MIIDCISDLHGHYPELEGGGLLIVAGDLTASHTYKEYMEFLQWLNVQNYQKCIYIEGNHDDFCMIHIIPDFEECAKIGLTFKLTHLRDCGTEFEGLKIWGSPWTHLFPGVNPKCTAFMLPEEELTAKWELIPDDVDILVTHSPPFTIRDKTARGQQVGSPSLLACHIARIRPKLWVFGHIHEGYGQEGPYEWNNTIYVNASIMNECYDPVNKPIRVVL